MAVFHNDHCKTLIKRNNLLQDVKSVPDKNYKVHVIWPYAAFAVIVSILSFYGLYFALTTSSKRSTLIFALILAYSSGFAITTGLHRLWSHKSYKAKWQLRLILMIFQTITFQFPIFRFAQDHRSHHKFTDTNADPSNINRGYFFGYIGWLIFKRHPDVKRMGQKIDVSDLTSDPIVMFQYKYFYLLGFLLCFAIPTAIPVYFWDETWMNAFFIPGLLRWWIVIVISLFGNSALHVIGTRPYEKSTSASDLKLISWLVLGEGWHNYHHAFPWDYRTAESGRFNPTAALIDFFAKIGWAYDLKSASRSIIETRVKRTGDGSHELWGWGDKDLSTAERENAIIQYQKNA